VQSNEEDSGGDAGDVEMSASKEDAKQSKTGFNAPLFPNSVLSVLLYAVIMIDWQASCHVY
jgi:hypothetical protein